MQPSPIADTSRLLFPSLRFCIVSPSSRHHSLMQLIRGPLQRVRFLAYGGKCSLVDFRQLPVSTKFLPDSTKPHSSDTASHSVNSRLRSRCTEASFPMR